jgi:hypothetical protein
MGLGSGIRKKPISDPHGSLWFGYLYLDRIYIKSWIRIRIETNADPQHWFNPHSNWIRIQPGQLLLYGSGSEPGFGTLLFRSHIVEIKFSYILLLVD